VTALDDLAGKSVYTRQASSYHESLLALNVRFKEAGQPPARIVTVPDALEDEDLLEMLNAGQLEALVVDDWKARMWAQVLPRIKVHENVRLREGGRIGWAVRKDKPRLSAELREFFADHIRKQNVHEARLAHYMRRVKRIKNSTAGSDWKRFEQTLALFEKYGEQYGFDPLMLAAQGYQESALDQRARSHVGAVGIMQIMPATGAELKVGDIRIAEPNVHAGAKYMDRLMAKYFKDAGFTGANRTLFAFASYNCGPGNVAKMRKAAAARGLDPDRWFNNVEIVTAEKIGIETTTYVRNIYKYYAAYRLALDAIGEQRQARERMQKGS
jgi:membrane-bound lytic murein transglycosylase MltF